jgi:hypothetical protein
MEQTKMKFDKRKQEPVTIQRLQQAVDLISQGLMLTQALRKVGLSGSMGKYLVDARILGRYDGKTVFVVKPKLERKDFYRIMEIQKKNRHKKYLQQKEKMKYTSFLLQKKDSQFVDIPTDMLGLVNMPKTEPIKLQRTPKPRVKKAVALPWWKRILLYLANR